jgi:pyruvate dehydrogenase E1 component
VAGHFEVPRGGRQISLLGDAELDEGACWEAIADPMVSRLGEVMWVVDLNRQSLDRVVPDIAAGRLASMFEAAGWHCVMVKYGPKLASQPQLRERIDAMPNEEYQRLLRADADELRERIETDVSQLDDHDLLATFRDLGGHDLGALVDAYRQADAEPGRPTVVFAYTIKGWMLPTEGHPANHSALLNDEQYAQLADTLGTDPGDPWATFADGRSPSPPPTRPPSRTTWGASTRARSPRSRPSAASSSTSRARRRRWRVAS